MNKLIYSILFTCYLLTFTVNISAAPLSMIAGSSMPSLAPLVAKVSPAVVNISISGNHQQILPELLQFFSPEAQLDEPQYPFIGLGSGVIVDAENGYIITNYHVIENATEIKVTLKSGAEFLAQIIGQDKQSDIALLQIKTDQKLTQIKFANSDKLRVGDFVIAIGNPFGLGQTVTLGIISALGRSGLNHENLENYIQTDAAINSGNSGGALVNLNGELIGINSAMLGPIDVNIGIGFAIPANMVNNLTVQLLQYGEIRRGMLGIKGEELTAELARTFALDSPHGVFIKQVIPDSAADEAGIKAGDVIVSMNGSAITSFAELRAKIGSLRAGKAITLGIIQDGKKSLLSVTLKEAQQHKIQTQSFHPSLAGSTLTDAGDDKGVMVTHVEQGSVAQHYGLQQGDIIIGINRTRVNNLNELTKQINRPPKILAFNIQRDNRRLYLILN
ncbi:MAG: Do/DeqQ family serine protease [Psychromonas sp.]|uniref:DegQ family serine endoprotease n=1 Tax=Psychromonas sp. TaxID=1884585 RepID=UPI0039E348D5